MRSVGKIKWYGGYNSKTQRENDYGFIQWEEREDLFVHKTQINDHEDFLREGSAVTFEVAHNSRNNRLEATNVILLKSETDVEVLKSCFLSVDPTYWKAVTGKYLARLPLEDATQIALKKLESLKPTDIREFVQRIPHEMLLVPDAEKLRQALPKEKHIQILVEHFLLMDTNKTIEEIVNLLEDASIYLREELIPKFPDALLDNKAIRKFLPALRRIHVNYLFTYYREEIIQDLSEVLLFAQPPERKIMLTDLPVEIKQDKRLFQFLSPIDQVRTYWEFIVSEDASRWNEFATSAKVLCIYRLVQENIEFPIQQLEERDLVIQSLLNIVWLYFHADKSGRITIFDRFHTRFLDYVVDIAWNSTEELDVYSILPLCEPKRVCYCEGKPWFTEEEKEQELRKTSRAYCARLRGACGANKRKSAFYKETGAHLYPNISQSWEHWSIQELFDSVDIVPKVKDLKDPAQYANKLSGWVNRLNDIRKRLACRKCGKTMIPNMEYSKKITAAYNMTIASCPDANHEHDHNIYFSHCWGCSEIIDSRDNRIQVDGYYLCLKCGSGPQSSLTFNQGDVCPRCGQKPMDRIDARSFHCSVCKHEILTPPTSTGNKLDLVG